MRKKSFSLCQSKNVLLFIAPIFKILLCLPDGLHVRQLLHLLLLLHKLGLDVLRGDTLSVLALLGKLDLSHILALHLFHLPLLSQVKLV